MWRGPNMGALHSHENQNHGHGEHLLDQLCITLQHGGEDSPCSYRMLWRLLLSTGSAIVVIDCVFFRIWNASTLNVIRLAFINLITSWESNVLTFPCTATCITPRYIGKNQSHFLCLKAKGFIHDQADESTCRQSVVCPFYFKSPILF